MIAIIIDDEIPSHIGLKAMLSNSSKSVEVLGSAYSVREGISLIDKLKPDIIFLDINLPDGLGFEILQKVQYTQFCIIFTTAHEHHALTAIKFGALDFLLKPFSSDELEEALEKVEIRINEKLKNISSSELEILMDAIQKLPHKELPQRISISTINGRIYIKTDNIIRFEADSNCTILHLKDEKKKSIVSYNTFGKYVEMLAPFKSFMKVHRSHLVNLLMVEKFIRGEGGYLIMSDASEVSVSSNYRDELLARLDSL
jgi:two-component system, LytTR family, response regulator